MRHGPTLALTLLLLSLPLSAQSPPDSIPEEVTPERIEEGYRLYQENSCWNCHGELARGGVFGPSLRDREWLHVDGRRVDGSYRVSFDGIVEVVTWGVREEDFRARGRLFEMKPRGGTDFTEEQMLAVSAYIWGQYYGLFQPSEEDRYAEYVLDRPVAETRELVQEYRADHGGTIPISASRLNRLASYSYNIRPRRRGLEIVDFALELYPDDEDLVYSRAIFLAGIVDSVSDSPEDLERAIRAAETALRLDPNHRFRERVEDGLEMLRARR